MNAVNEFRTALSGLAARSHPADLVAGCPLSQEEFGVRKYHSIFLDDDWAHQKYYGWNLIEDHPGLRVLERRRFALLRNLMLLTKGGEARLDDAVTRARGRLGLADVIIHDFDCVLPDPPLLARLQFRRSEQRERLLNIATYVVDLKEDYETLWKNLGTKSRNAVRKAESSKMRYVHDKDFKSAIECFYRFYQPIARQYALETPDYKILEKMQKGGNLICVSCERDDGKTSLVNLLYLTGNCGFYMYGASDLAVGTGTGQFVQWNSILLLKEMGFGWYDLGGVQDPRKMDGIHQFKKSIGGVFRELGNEFRYEAQGFAITKSYFNRLHRRG